MTRELTIIGGGLAGLTLGIGLLRDKINVTVIESSFYPRHRVCGEFISGHGLQTLARLGLLQKLTDAGAIPARTALFCSKRKQTHIQTLPEPALCLSRYRLDALLADEFRRLGGHLREGTRWPGKTLARGFIRASGRRVQVIENGWRFVGTKVHASNVVLEADLELHFRPDGYIGICRLADGRVNICGLLRTRFPLPSLSDNWGGILRGTAGSALYRRLEKAEFDESSFCCIAGLSLTPHKASESEECAIGDALTMIPPFTGNGMSMAFESAELAIEPLSRYGRAEISWEEAREKIAYDCDRLFKTRLRWAGWTQRALMQPMIRDSLLHLSSHFCHLSEFLFAKTR